MNLTKKLTKPSIMKGITYTGTSTPSAGVAGDTWYNSSLDEVRVYTSSEWQLLFSADYPSGSGTSGFVDENDEPL